MHLLKLFVVCVHMCTVVFDSFVTLETVAHQTPLSTEFSRQEYGRELPFPPPGDLPNPGIKPTSPKSPAWGGGFLATKATWEAQVSHLPLDIIIDQCPRLPECLPLSLAVTQTSNLWRGEEMHKGAVR